MESNPHLEIEEDEIEVLEVKRGEGFETANSCSNKDSEEPNIEIRSSVSSLIQRDEEEEENDTSSHGYLEFQDGTQENGNKSTTLHEDVRDAQECPPVDMVRDETMTETSMCESDNATEDERGNESFDILGSEATSEPDLWNLEDCNQPELPCIASTDNCSSRSDSWQESEENWEDEHQDSEECQHGRGDGPRGHGERQDKPGGSGQSQDKGSEMPKSEDINLVQILELVDAHMAENEERKYEDSKKVQTEDFHLQQKDESDLTNNEVLDLLPHEIDANPAKDKDYYSQKDTDSDSDQGKAEDEDLPRDEDEDTANNEDEDLPKDEDGDLARAEDSDTANDRNEDLPRDEAEDLPKDEDGDQANNEDEDLAKDEVPKLENPGVPKGGDTGPRENEGSDQKEKNRFGAESVSCCEEQATRNPELDTVSDVMKNPEASKSETEELAIQPRKRKLRRRKVKSSTKVMGGGGKVKVKVDVTDSNPILDICFDSLLRVLDAKPVSSLKPCFVRLARMDKIPSSILRQLASENSRL